MKDIFKIYTDRLRDDDTENIAFEASPDFLEIDEKELTFNKKIAISGKAYLVQDNLIIDLNAKTYYNMPCSFCNEMVENLLQVEHFTQVIAHDDIKNAVFDFSSILRDEILLQLPQFVKCNLNSCKQKEVLNKYLKKDLQGNFPFEELEL